MIIATSFGYFFVCIFKFIIGIILQMYAAVAIRLHCICCMCTETTGLVKSPFQCIVT